LVYALDCAGGTPGLRPSRICVRRRPCKFDESGCGQGIKGAAEQAVPQAKELMVTAVKARTLEDAKKILTGAMIP
jgi:Protein of unknown function (DUF4197)